jgi:hypothetical protein
MDFKILGEIDDIETFATASGIRELARLRKRYGRGRWRKRKGYAEVRLSDGTIVRAELHWYEATGIGKREFKIKRFL